MLLLQKLPPPTLPTPLSYEDWKLQVTGTKTNCKHCNDTGTTECRECDGTGEVECCECGNEKECEDCDGTGKWHCHKCNGELTYAGYVNAVTSDYRKFLAWRSFVMPHAEIRAIAVKNAHNNDQLSKARKAA